MKIHILDKRKAQYMDFSGQFDMLLSGVESEKSKREVFNDFLTLSLYTYTQPFYRSIKIERETREIYKQYKKSDIEQFQTMLTLALVAIDARIENFWEDVCIYSGVKGDDSKSGIYISIESNSDREERFFTMREAESRTGSSIVRFADCMNEEGFDYLRCLKVIAGEKDEIYFKITYLQLAFRSIAGEVSLLDEKGEVKERLFTPMYFINGVYLKDKEFEAVKAVRTGDILASKIKGIGRYDISDD